jgi:uncharacterized membrane protein
MRPSHPALHILFVRLRSASEWVSQSLFVIPALCVVAAVVLAEGLLAVDGFFSSQYLPPIFHTTVDSARSLLGTIAGAVITVTGLVFSLALVAVQLASSQFSPRTLRILYRSRFQQFIMGFMVGTFTYCLLVLRDLHAPFQSGGEASIPSISILGALALAVGAGLAILAYVNHIAHMLQVSEMIRRATQDTLETLHSLTRHQGLQTAPDEETKPLPEGAHAVYAKRGGWVQQINNHALLGMIEQQTALRLETRVGNYVSQGSSLCTIWPPPEDPDYMDTLVCQAIKQGPVRTTQEDIAFGIRQLSDIALRALSPGVNDPTTAYEVIVHLGEILQNLLCRDLPPRAIAGEQGRRLLRPHELSHTDYINQAFDQIRIAGNNQAAIDIALLETLGTLLQGQQQGHDSACIDALQRQAALVLQGARTASFLPEDRERIRIAAREAGFEPEGVST